MFLKFGIASNEIIMRIVLGKSENLQNEGYRRSTSNSGHTLLKQQFQIQKVALDTKYIKTKIRMN